MERHFQKILKIFVFIICESAEIYPNFKAQFLSLCVLFQKAAGSWWRSNLLAFKWCTPTWAPRIPIGPFLASKGGHFFAFFGHFSKILKKKKFLLLFFKRALGYLQKDKKILDQLSFLWEIGQIQKLGLLGPLWGVAFLKWPFRGQFQKSWNFI